MKSGTPLVVGLRQEDAIKVLKAEGIDVKVKTTQPPRPRLKKEPVLWRVIAQRETEEGIELVVTPEWINWLSLNVAEKP